VTVLAEPPAAARALQRNAGEELVALLAFGSRVTGAGPDARSAWDLFAVVRDYAAFYGRCRDGAAWRRSARGLARWNRILPPNVLHLAEPGGPGAKLFVISEHDLERALQPARADHFCRARLMQRVEVHADSPADHARMGSLLAGTRRAMVSWLRPFLRGPFDAGRFCRELLAVSYRSEIRPEPAGRAAEVFLAQSDYLLAEYGAVLEAAAERGELVREGSGFRYARPAGLGERLGARWRLQLSKLRSTLRWPKYVLTFDGWQDYIAAKVERRVGLRVVLTERERRHPFLFLWPKLFRVLRARGR
jgi:hypothetical protein